MNNLQIEKNSNGILRITKGIIISIIISLISIFIFSIILTYSSISEGIIPIAIIVLTFISILIGTIISTRAVRKNGMLNGGIIGGVYVFMLYIISSISNAGFQLNTYTILMITFGLLGGIIGGIIGINS